LCRRVDVKASTADVQPRDTVTLYCHNVATVLPCLHRPTTITVDQSEWNRRETTSGLDSSARRVRSHLYTRNYNRAWPVLLFSRHQNRATAMRANVSSRVAILFQNLSLYAVCLSLWQGC